MRTFTEDILDFAEVLSVQNDTLALKHGIDLWKCKRIYQLPEYCIRPEGEIDTDPLLNYDVFWHSFKEHYCSFKLKNIDWDSVNVAMRPRISERTTELELYLIFEEIIALLEDGHIKMDVPDSIEDEYERAVDIAPNKYHTFDVFETAEALAMLYVDSLRSFNAGMSRWGMIGEDIGYLQVNSMLMQAHYDLPDSLTLTEFEIPYWVDNVSHRKDEVHRQEEAAGMKATLDQVQREMPNARMFIIDLRFNGGGKDGVAMEIMNHFSSYSGTMARKYVQENGQFVNHQNIKNSPSTNGFDGPVYILTSHMTASAAELAVLCSLADEKFTRIGSTTEGIFSSTLDKVLPNGWDYEFSNEVYMDLNGRNYEHTGISPDYLLGYSSDIDGFIGGLKSEIEQGADAALEMVQELALNEPTNSANK